jgi:hypothetical protein
LSVIKALAEIGADLDMPVACGAGPVHIAARQGHASVIKLLYKLGADMKPDFLRSVKEIALSYNHTEAAQVTEKIMNKLSTNECFCCFSMNKRLKLCSKCLRACYCSRKCQLQDHKHHKGVCSDLKRSAERRNHDESGRKMSFSEMLANVQKSE